MRVVIRNVFGEEKRSCAKIAPKREFSGQRMARKPPRVCLFFARASLISLSPARGSGLPSAPLVISQPMSQDYNDAASRMKLSGALPSVPKQWVRKIRI